MMTVVTALLALAATMAGAEAPDTNVVTAAGDAFGVTIGLEAVGLYSPSQVRGFDPLAAGNARIEGLYFDVHGPTIPYGPLPLPLVQDIRVRIGLAAEGFPFPSPTGIVDFSLRNPLGAPALSPVLYVGPYGTNGFDLDGHAPLGTSSCGIGGGLSRRWDEFAPGGTQHTTDVGVLIACHPSERLSFGGFYGRLSETDQAVWPIIYLRTAGLPSVVDAHETAPSWARTASGLIDYGALLRLDLPAGWTLRTGIFRSIYDQPHSASDLLYDPTPAGLAQHQFVAYPDQATRSTSGELRLTHLSAPGPRRHELVLSLRARDVHATSGGYDQRDFGTELIGTRDAIPEPTFVFGPVTLDHTTQWTAGAAYLLHWREVAEFAVGLEQVRYDRTITEPGSPNFVRHETPALFYASLARPFAQHGSAYAAVTRGLEDSGLAPASASNRGQLLPANRTRQEEAGVRWGLGTRGAIVAGVFQVLKPYFNVDASGNYVWLGTEQHRGVELSLTGEPTAGLTVVTGALLMRPHVGVAPASAGTTGESPVSQSRRLMLGSADYRPGGTSRWSFDFVLSHEGPVPVRLDDGAYTHAWTMLNLGGRYRFPVGGYPATLRIQVQNATNQKVWSVVDPSGGIAAYPPLHMALAYLSVEL
jgi:iron complex outermembrane receptor protein